MFFLDAIPMPIFIFFEITVNILFYNELMRPLFLVKKETEEELPSGWGKKFLFSLPVYS
jgi:hypothetical protein